MFEDDWEEEAMRQDLERAQDSLNILKFFFVFEKEVTLPAPPPENEEEEWNGLHLTAKVWYELGA